MPRVKWRRESQDVRGEFSTLRTSLASLENSLDKMWDRLESIHQQYMLVLQQSSNKKLNVLAIVQAVFVPLTFIGGVYGMNFINMPELEWQYGYVATLGFMGLITLFSLQYFIRHGWFK
ncbi:MAG: CorA family divalent cation transporter [Bacteroidota bacterium]